MMLYMVELRYSLRQRDAALAFLLQHGTTHYGSHVSVKDAWVATEDRHAYAIVEAKDVVAIAAASKSLEPFGEVTFRHVTNFNEL